MRLFVVVLLSAFLSACGKKTPTLMEGYGKLRSPDGSWEIELNEGDSGLTVTQRGGGLLRFESSVSPVGWRNQEGCFVFLEEDEAIAWAFNGVDELSIIERNKDGSTSWSVGTWPRDFPRLVFERLPERLQQEMEARAAETGKSIR